jgi:hypothetical protein
MSQFVGYEQIVYGPAVQTVAALTIPPTTIRAQLQAETSDMRYTMDGNPVRPTPAEGMLLLQDEPPEWFEVEDLQRIRFLGDGGAVGQLNIHYYGTFQ